MTKRNIGRHCGLALAAASLVGACSSELPQQGEHGSGTVQMALQAQGSQGGTYRLAGTFALDDPESTSVTVDQTDSSPTISLSPQVGTYNLALCDATSPNALCAGSTPWVLFKIECFDLASNPAPDQLCQDDPANFQEVATAITTAQLTTANPQSVDVLLNQTTYVSYQFYVPGEGTINFARGTLNIDVNVGEGYPDGYACTTDVECASKVCAPDPMGVQVCQPPSCTDGVQNGDETGADCGGSCPVLCPGTCAASTDCSAGEACVNGQCVSGTQGCIDDTMCPAGFVCDPNTGVCVDPNGGGVCPDGTTCPAGYICDATTLSCVPDPNGSGSGCVDDTQCPANYVCDATSQTCVPGSTNGGCTADSDCALGEICDTTSSPTQCIPDPNGGTTLPCDSAGTCSSPAYVCVAGTCEPGSSQSCGVTGGGCPSSYYCDNNGQCQPTSGTCTSPTTCSTGAEICNTDGYCQLACTLDADCPPLTSSGQPGACDPLVGYCAY